MMLKYPAWYMNKVTLVNEYESPKHEIETILSENFSDDDFCHKLSGSAVHFMHFG